MTDDRRPTTRLPDYPISRLADYPITNHLLRPQAREPRIEARRLHLCRQPRLDPAVVVESGADACAAHRGRGGAKTGGIVVAASRYCGVRGADWLVVDHGLLELAQQLRAFLDLTHPSGPARAVPRHVGPRRKTVVVLHGSERNRDLRGHERQQRLEVR